MRSCSRPLAKNLAGVPCGAQVSGCEFIAHFVGTWGGAGGARTPPVLARIAARLFRPFCLGSLQKVARRFPHAGVFEIFGQSGTDE